MKGVLIRGVSHITEKESSNSRETREGHPMRCKGDPNLCIVKIIRAAEREIRVTGVISLPISVGEASTMQKLYVAPTICRAMILDRLVGEK